MQRLHGLLGVTDAGHDGDANLGSRDHLDVDAALGEGSKESCGDARMRAHARTDERHLGDLLVDDEVFEGNLSALGLNGSKRLLRRARRSCESDVGATG